ncbi:FAD-dependent oxidoreductase [Mediterraneibacter glycyrrhizinilyticus]|uniref:NAD(P)/FAD-dependent oxidoreductase n=1 Tax=Mediterraneibacter glycyrrhizinilyticus TaxID=342942 RepID=UPI00265B3145|nr:NAD(P)-binding protein [Mediterraneibacter glycyrrhizinilyticus]MCF2568818.1 FAD-dependent oxidoreductase [Mediterraneibacter glycyrrhizinilyticus]
MLRINQLKLSVTHTQEQLEKKLIKTLKINRNDMKQYRIRKRSLDARKKPELCYVYSIDLEVKHEERILKQLKGKAVKVSEESYRVPEHGSEELHDRPVIVGSGPAGLFCAYILAREGYRPLIVERGAPVRERKKDVERFWETGVLDPDSNVQFGEGGAGTFSDGKLNTLVKDAAGRNRFVLETFVQFGAPEDILWEQKPHIGTDILIDVVERMRGKITELGGEICFHSQVTDILPDERCLVINGKEKIRAGAAVLAIGHSARDTFEMLFERGFCMEAKSFAVGVRVEHPQQLIDRNMYGRDERDGLPAASYKLTEKLDNGRGVYTFCMCPGGYVVNASSEPGLLAVNGMSYHGRAGENANSAVIVTVTPDDYGSDHPLAGVQFQRDLERRAWEAGAGNVPVQRFEDFCENRKSEELGSIKPNIKGHYSLANVRGIFPEELSLSLQQGIERMDHKIRGFADKDVLLSGVESRTSSPVRISRDEGFRSSIPWIYPCGEGAGYAGGITSAAMDGIKVAEAVISKYRLCE